MNNANKADLHTHTTASDGLNRPAENIRLAKLAGLAAVAITDHDTLAGLQEALAAGQEYGITVVPGIEISTTADGKDIHVLGYGIAYDDPALLARLAGLRDVRYNRNGMILANLASLGMEVRMSEIEEEAGRSGWKGGTVGRPHIAQVLVDKGYASDIRDAFDRYLGEGKAAYANPPRITPRDAIDWIREAGGVAIVAHPGLYGNDALVFSLLEEGGADGLEAFHSDHNPEEESKYEAYANAHNLLATGGSDFHGERKGEAFHGPIGNRTVDASIVPRLLGGQK